MDLKRFEFDCDLTWYVFLLNADETVYGRYGGRDATSADSRLSLTGLKYAMTKALEAHQQPPPKSITNPSERVTPEMLAAGKGHKGCIHCHNIKEFERANAIRAGTWNRESLWVYPLPENVGLTLDVDIGNRVKSVAKDSAAALAGFKPGDFLNELNGVRIASFADATYALHKSPVKGTITATYERNNKPLTATLTVKDGWRKTNITWRPSMLELMPSLAFNGDDLSTAQKTKLGLDAKRAVFRQDAPVHKSLTAVGLLAGDVVIGFDGAVVEGTISDLLGHVRRNYLIGDTIKINVLRDSKPVELKLELR
ncbi:hypothetical protein BH11PLA2_BH11PLA2_25630 [soil metagenome]